MKYIPPEKKYYVRQGESLTLKQAFSRMIEQSSFGKQYYRILAVEAWRKLMGETVARRTSRIFLKNGQLFVELTSAPLRQELFLIREQIVARVNEEVGKSVVNELVFL